MPDANRPRLPLLFLSHAGIDTEAARALMIPRQLEAARRWHLLEATCRYRPMPQVAPLVAPLADKLTTRCFVYKVN